jgi:hypothetical protein
LTFTINWIGCSRSNGIGVHDRPERAPSDLTNEEWGYLEHLIPPRPWDDVSHQKRLPAKCPSAIQRS